MNTEIKSWEPMPVKRFELDFILEELTKVIAQADEARLNRSSESMFFLDGGMALAEIAGCLSGLKSLVERVKKGEQL